RSGDDGQEHVLEHVDAEELGRDRVDPRGEREQERDETEEERRAAPPRQWTAEKAQAARVDDAREDRGEDR
ncbi:MAG TPA: hypothetical protein VJQ09_02985, partial [Candidatus Limnocylindria bacterium]|nr:hypothetical protein [Candidatus Limnocylindria bacterium]